MHIDWASLLHVTVVAAAAALTVVLLIAFGLVGWSDRAARPVPGSDAGTTTGTRPAAGTTVAVLCALAAGLIVCYGIYRLIA
jgi:uncharacterized iron-regulated membrane protein